MRKPRPVDVISVRDSDEQANFASAHLLGLGSAGRLTCWWARPMFLQIRATRRKLFVLALAGTRSGAFLGEPLQRHAQRRITQLLICFHVIEHQHDARQGGGSTLRIGYSTHLGLSCMQNLHLGMDKQSDRPRSSHRFACGLIPRFCSHQHTHFY